MEEITQATLNDEPQQSAPSMDETIADAWKDITSRGEVARDESGKFAATQTEETPTDIPADTPEEPPAEEAAPEESTPEQPSIKAPSSWKKEAQAKFAALDPDIQAEVLRRENDMHNGIAQYKQYAERAQALDRAMQPYQDTLNKLGYKPEEAAAKLMGLDHVLRHGSPAQKVAIVRDIIGQYQINPEWFDQAAQPQVNPEVGYLQNKLQEIEAQQARFQQAAQEREASLLNSDIQAFAGKNEHFEQVRDRMADLLQGGAAKTLQEAYDMAIWADPNVRASILAKQQAEERAKAEAKAKEAKRLAALNVQKRGVVPAQKPVGSIDETIRAAAKELGMI